MEIIKIIIWRKLNNFMMIFSLCFKILMMCCFAGNIRTREQLHLTTHAPLQVFTP